MAATSHLSLTFVESSQAQKEVTVNEAFARIDALMNTGALDKDLNAPPGTPAVGDVYLIGGTPSGDWAGHAREIAYFDQLWRFIAPREGMTMWVNDEQRLYTYSGSAWLATQRGRQSFYIHASQMRPSVSGGCAALAVVALGAGQPDIATLDFDPSTEESAQFSLRMPLSWDAGAITCMVEWSHGAATVNYGVAWGVQALSLGDGDGMASAFGAAQTVADTGGSASTLYKTALTPGVTPSGGAQAGDTLWLRLLRKTADAADTLAVDARLHGVTVFYGTVCGSE